ncbi:MAG: ribulose-phosphate 3-epimerase [Anaerolineae bacterium]|nr:ribulose-phosphate 3-epimerase [Anaerolineae bacterium]
MNAIRIAPSILAADFTRLGEQIAEAEAGGGDLIHIDIMDGRFVPNLTMGPFIVEAVRRVTSLPLDVHLMIIEPERHVANFINAGANNITVHVEVSPNLNRTIQQIREGGANASVVLNPHTHASAIQEILPFVDMVLVMTVNPGYGGQKFIRQTLPKIREIRTMIERLDHTVYNQTIAIQVDGGIDTQTAPLVVAHGANVLVAGTSVFRAAEGVAAGIAALREAVGAAH